MEFNLCKTKNDSALGAASYFSTNSIIQIFQTYEKYLTSDSLNKTFIVKIMQLKFTKKNKNA